MVKRASPQRPAAPEIRRRSIIVRSVRGATALGENPAPITQVIESSCMRKCVMPRDRGAAASPRRDYWPLEHARAGTDHALIAPRRHACASLVQHTALPPSRRSVTLKAPRRSERGGAPRALVARSPAAPQARIHPPPSWPGRRFALRSAPDGRCPRSSFDRVGKENGRPRLFGRPPEFWESQEGRSGPPRLVRVYQTPCHWTRNPSCPSLEESSRLRFVPGETMMASEGLLR